VIRDDQFSIRYLNRNNHLFGVKTNPFVYTLVILFVAAALPWRAEGQERQTSISIEGTVTYQPKMGLPQGAILRLEVAEATTGENVWRDELKIEHDQNPIPFALAVPSEKIEQGHGYRIDSEIIIKGRTWYRGSFKLPEDLRNSAKNINMVLSPNR